INGYANIILQEHGERLPPDARDRVRTIIDVVTQMGSMVDGLLELSQTARAPIKEQPLDLAVLAREVAAQCQHGAAHKVEFVAPPSVPAAGDKTLLRIALQNLLGNAWKFSSKQAAPRVEFGVQGQAEQGPVYFV